MMGIVLVRLSWAYVFCHQMTPSLNKFLSGQKNSEDIAQLMRWLGESSGRRERQILLKRVLDLLDETQYALNRLDELR